MKCVYSINWDAVTAIAACLEVLLVLVPAIILVINYKLCYIEFWFYKKTSNGVTIVLHNKSKSSLFLLDQTMINKRHGSKKKCRISLPLNNENNNRIEPDGITYIPIDYAIYKTCASDKKIIKLKFGGKFMKKKIKI